jgi:hypothetical protein
MLADLIFCDCLKEIKKEKRKKEKRKKKKEKRKKKKRKENKKRAQKNKTKKMAEMLYSHAWITPENLTIDVTVRGKNKRIEYTEARGVIQKAWEIESYGGKKDRSEKIEVLGKFRDELGRRMPAATCACALIASIYMPHSASAGNTTVQKKRIDEKAVYVEHTDGNETAYKHTLTKLDQLFSKVFKDEECLKSEFRDIKEGNPGGSLQSGWLETDHIYKFWKTIKAHLGKRVRVDLFENLMYKDVTKERVLKLANAIRKSMNRHYEAEKKNYEIRKSMNRDDAAGKIWGSSFNDGTTQTALDPLVQLEKKNYVALFPINFTDEHHTIARAEYDNTESTLVVTYYDSLNYDGTEKCGFIHKAFVGALKGASENGYEWALGNNIKYTMEAGTMQKQEDKINCGVFVCMLMLKAAGGDKPKIHERTVDEGDIRKVRCIIARNHKKEPPKIPIETIVLD